MWEKLNGVKTILGIAIAMLGVLACIQQSPDGWSFAAAVDCLKALVASPETLAGAGIGVAAIGGVHKVAKAGGGAE